MLHSKNVSYSSDEPRYYVVKNLTEVKIAYSRKLDVINRGLA